MEHPPPLAKLAFAGLDDRLAATEHNEEPAPVVVAQLQMLENLADEVPRGLGADAALQRQLVEAVEKEEEALLAGIRIDRIVRKDLGRPHIVPHRGGEGAGHVEQVEGNEKDADSPLPGGVGCIHP